MPSHYLNQCCNIVNWIIRNKFQWNLNRKFIHFHPRKRIWKCRLKNGGHFVLASIFEWQYTSSFAIICLLPHSEHFVAFFQWSVVLKFILRVHKQKYWNTIHPVRPSVCPSVCLSVRPSVRPWVGVRMITLILFSGLKNFFYIYHLGQDLAWDWISASYLIKYAHTGRSCDLLIFGIPEINFLVRAFQFGMKGVLSRIYDISPGFCWIPIFVFFLNFLRVS